MRGCVARAKRAHKSRLFLFSVSDLFSAPLLLFPALVLLFNSSSMINALPVHLSDRFPDPRGDSLPKQTQKRHQKRHHKAHSHRPSVFSFLSVLFGAPLVLFWCFFLLFLCSFFCSFAALVLLFGPTRPKCSSKALQKLSDPTRPPTRPKRSSKALRQLSDPTADPTEVLFNSSLSLFFLCSLASLLLLFCCSFAALSALVSALALLFNSSSNVKRASRSLIRQVPVSSG